MSGHCKPNGVASHPDPCPVTPARPASLATVLSGSIDTPMSGSSHGSDFGYLTVHDQMRIVKEELTGHVYCDGKLGQESFAGKVPADSKIIDFLRKCPLYDNSKKRWKKIPKSVKQEEVLYGPMTEILQAVVKHFSYSGSRQVIDTHNVSYCHEEGSGDNRQTKALKTSPDIFVKAKVKGPFSNFTFKPETLKKPDYRLCASPVEIKTKKNRNFFENICQAGVYARQCFIQQHNRKFVYCLIITEEIVQLCMFDRSGVYHSFDINIHKDATDFVRIILGVVSPDDHVLGFDTTVVWDKQMKRYLTTVDAENQPVRYTLASTKPIFCRRAILGRGTCCWQALDGDGNLLLVKDSWRSSGRIAESEFLEAAKGLAGVGQMIAFEERDLISALRGINMDTISEDLKSFRDRILTRLIFKYGGKPIDMFESAEEVLYAFRDAIAGHRNLWNTKILHRDVSVNNILIGTDSSNVGNRGLIIDLDLAIWIDRVKSLAGVDFRTGTRAFQSVNVLNSYSPEDSTVPHDYLDDLESFFYVLCWVCCGHDRPKPHDNAKSQAEKVNPQKILPFPVFLTKWEDANARAAADAKKGMFFDLRFKHSVTAMFKDEAGSVFPNLLEKLFQFFKDQAVRKNSFPDDEPRPALMDLVPTAVDHYKAVLEIFDDAIEEFVTFKASAKEKVPQPAPTVKAPVRTPTTPTKRRSMRLSLQHPGNGSTSPGSRSIRKRGSDTEFPLEDSPTAKKLRKDRKDYKPSRPSSLSMSLDDDD